jgi:HEPN domain
VRESQDVVELVLKGALRFVGVEPPKRHDVHGVMGRFLDRFPAEWGRALDELREDLGELARDRAPAFYGDEERDIRRRSCSASRTPAGPWPPRIACSTCTGGCSKPEPVPSLAQRPGPSVLAHQRRSLLAASSAATL